MSRGKVAKITQEAIMASVAAGHTYEDAAKAIGVTPRAVYQRCLYWDVRMVGHAPDFVAKQKKLLPPPPEPAQNDTLLPALIRLAPYDEVARQALARRRGELIPEDEDDPPPPLKTGAWHRGIKSSSKGR